MFPARRYGPFAEEWLDVGQQFLGSVNVRVSGTFVET